MMVGRFITPSVRLPDVGCSMPMIILNSVDLPTPFGPMTPTMPFRGSSKDRSSISTRSPNCLCRCSTLSTSAPKRGPAGIWISVKSSFFDCAASAAIWS